MDGRKDGRATDEDLPSDDSGPEREGERRRKEMDEIPPHGTDPLHEGP